MAIKKNQVVTMFYELKINDELVESNLETKPIQFVFGTEQLISGLEAGIEDMNEGETKDIKVSPEDGYGEYDEKLKETLPIENFEGIDLEIGTVVEADDEDNEVIRATVIEVTKDEVTVDYNHPLAGSVLDFKVTIKSIV
ncbi:MAG: FKBP-type peptidyl-prolyl cis-trans isomerase [Halarcobacter sp.]